jgi:hypothetical protein
MKLFNFNDLGLNIWILKLLLKQKQTGTISSPSSLNIGGRQVIELTQQYASLLFSI